MESGYRRQRMDQGFTILGLDEGPIDIDRGGQAAGGEQSAVSVEDVTSRAIRALFEPRQLLGSLRGLPALGHLHKPKTKAGHGEHRSEDDDESREYECELHGYLN